VLKKEGGIEVGGSDAFAIVFREHDQLCGRLLHNNGIIFCYRKWYYQLRRDQFRNDASDLSVAAAVGGTSSLPMMGVG
jgi:hypothetical protein